MSFDLDAFIAQINQDKTKSRSNKDQLNRVLMNVRANQGTVTFIPVWSKAVENFYLKVPRVYEFYGDTSLLQNGEAWYRILPLEFYGNLNEKQIELYHEVKGYLDTLNNNEEVSYDEFRVRNYSLFYGICQSLINTEKAKNEELENCPCLFVYPSNSVIDQLGTAVNNKIDTMKGRREWITSVFNPANTGWKGVLQISFVKSSGVGYDSSVYFEFNSDLNTVVDPDFALDDQTAALFDDVIPTFLGWIYDRNNKSNFNEIAFKELRDQLKLRIKESTEGVKEPADASKTYENKNDLAPKSEIAAPKTSSEPF